MPRGNIDIAERGKNTRFTRESAVEAGRKGNAVRRANIPIRKCLKNIASEALYGHPPMPDEQMRPVARFFSIKTKDVTFAHVAIFKQIVEAAKGDASALNLVAAYAGEKPNENISVTTSGSFEALNAAFEGMKDHEPD